ncbi:MAG: hypothetical protein SCJ97_10140 [Bacillota bacterium]|nr:hypothetical protein [Bacillota bacterium]
MRLFINEQGIAMPLVLIILLVLGLLGAALWHYSMSELNQSVRDEQRTRAYYLARAGAESIARHIMINPEIITMIEIGETLTSDELGFDVNEKNVGDIVVNVERLDRNIIEVTGIGTVEGVSHSVSIVLEAEERFDGVIYSAGGVNFQNNVTVNGDIVSGSTVTWQGEDYPLPAGHPNVDGTRGTIRENVIINFPPPEFPDLPESYDGGTLTIDVGSTETPITATPAYAYQKIEILNNKDAQLEIKGSASEIVSVEAHTFEMGQNSDGLIFNTSNGDVNLIVSEINIKKIRVIGGGTARIYVRNTANIQTKMGDVQISEDGMIMILLDQGAKLVMQAKDAYFEGLVYGPEAFFISNGNAIFEGSMIVNHVTGNNDSAIGSSKSEFNEKYKWDDIGSLYGGYLMVHWVR